MNFKKRIGNKNLARILLPLFVGVFSYAMSMQYIEHSFFIHVLYIATFNYIGLFIGFIISEMLNKIGKKETVVGFFKNTHTYILTFLFIILLIGLEKMYGEGVQMVFAGFFLWMTSEAN